MKGRARCGGVYAPVADSTPTSACSSIHCRNVASAADIQALLLNASTAAAKQPKKKQQQQQQQRPQPKQAASPSHMLPCTLIEWGEEQEEVTCTLRRSIYEPISCHAGGGLVQERRGQQRGGSMRRQRREDGGDAAEVAQPVLPCAHACCADAWGRYIAQHGQPLAKVSGSGSGDGGAAAGGAEPVWAEEFEDDDNRHWMRYALAMERDPEQAVRYSWAGRALWPRAPPAPPPCPVCAAPRAFECQLMPPLLRLLNVDALALAVCVHRFLHCFFVTFSAGIAAAMDALLSRGHWHTRCRVTKPMPNPLLWLQVLTRRSGGGRRS